jgi:hypothetical protein
MSVDVKPLSRKLANLSNPPSSVSISHYSAAESMCDDLNVIRAVKVCLRDRMSRRGDMPVSQPAQTNRIHGETLIVAETGKKLPV